ncbi:MAG: NAD-dependent epimerase/dehydratase [Candidatus Woesebacteria bacterium GW2011_GWC2_47_16]|uniref:NAD-dependent epimerase/dehydratase n=6 Tax=Candidatus Woeseibacteriota TaxID=1752722 RepID=A0A0G1QW17_9BACT|nr:MAG: NAD-dependent epimerase/dehydratase [Candidatus Woesebacteria bacterium GW2011_GWE1_45_18]KKU23630.1 MAG: NAD-dependent epimerase/dehydratase [Candidatus Woesebacteria bacterium GW2011_GWF1_46_13]KKU49126.1 MAG: NAD-dependent epimerase/dehydratase [Candidatus Woesebacteria bacterium GW2011_GWF2_46_8]KKU63627.1 MAG: NAD-dependent epimerase/dehydratase [Candidatus Woesebacteria bacterium GW2011_GWC2_47_16]
MKVLIVGGAGYLGGALTDILLKTDHKIRVYDALMYEDDYLKKVPFILGDIRNRTYLKKHLRWANAVVWLAALVGDGACALNPDISKEINQESVKWLADNFDGRIIFPSTCSVYGVHKGILTEDSPVGPLSVYGVTKLTAEGFLKKKNAIIFRIGTLFGLGDRYSRIRLDLVVNTLTARAMTDRKLKIFGGKQYRPLLHVRDAAQAIADNLETKHTGIFNLHSENIKILNLARKVVKSVPGTKINFVDMKVGDMRNYRASSFKAKKAFGFSPKLSVEDGIEEIKQLFEKKRIKDINDPRYTNEGHLTMFNSHKLVDESGKPKIIDGGISIDDRGQVTFVNDFGFKDVKRFYMVSNHAAGFVRAWHAHKKEAKYVLVTAGAVLFGLVPINNWKKPAKRAKVERYVLSSKSPKLLYIPPGYANGYMSLTDDAQLIFYSTSTLTDSEGDDFRYPSRYWDIWKVEER